MALRRTPTTFPCFSLSAEESFCQACLGWDSSAPWDLAATYATSLPPLGQPGAQLGSGDFLIYSQTTDKARAFSSLMASSVVDRKFLGTLAKEVEPENPLLSSTLYKILGLSDRLSGLLVTARKQRKLAPQRAAESQHLHHRILWLAREGLVMLEQYVLPMVTNSNQLKVLAYKLRASLYHIVVLFHNQPPVHAPFVPPPMQPPKVDKGKGIARDDDDFFVPSDPAHQAAAAYDGGPVAPPPGFSTEPGAAFLLPVGDYLPCALKCFRDAEDLADRTLWGSHSLRLSIKTEFSAFLFECVHDEEASRKLARKTINEVYEATEGIDNDMFQDACELVTVLGKMMKRGLQRAPSSTRSKASGDTAATVKSAQPEGVSPPRTTTMAAVGLGSGSEVPQQLGATPVIAPQPLFARPPGTTGPEARPPHIASTVLPPASEAQPGFI